MQKQIIGGRPYQGLKTEGMASPYGGLRPKDKGINIQKRGRSINVQNEIRNGKRPRSGSSTDKPGYGAKPKFEYHLEIILVKSKEISLGQEKKKGL